MYHRLIEDYLTYYQPELKANLTRAQALQHYLESQVEAMLAQRGQIIDYLHRQEPEMSRTQREAIADQASLAQLCPGLRSDEQNHSGQQRHQQTSRAGSDERAHSLQLGHQDA